MNIDMNLKIRSKFINAPGKAVIKELEFSSGKGLGDRFIGVPRTLVINLLKTKNNEMVLDFIVEGKIDDPKFNISENLVKRLTVDLAGKLGLSVVEAGKSVVVLGVEGVKEVGKGIRGIGEGLQKIFRK
ncbi:MAG: hypothetical protein HY099_02960 [Nitrospirae bacterium]|nr:hypothetical protein [Nitrospirota bacterium]